MAAPDFFTLSSEPLAVLGLAGEIHQANGPLVELLGFSAEELRGLKPEDLVHPDEVQLWKDSLSRLENGVTPAGLEVRCKRKSGDWVWIRWRCASAVNGEICAVARDVTSGRERWNRLQQLERILNAVNAEAWLLNREARVVQTNTYAQTILGKEADQLVGQRREDLKPGFDSPADSLAESLQSIATGIPSWRSLERWKSGAEDRWAMVDRTPLHDENGKTDGLIVFGYDVTGQIQAEGEFRRLNEQLELRVATRTEELAAVNTALIGSEERLRKILETALDGVIFMAPDGHCTGWNKAAEKMLGWRMEDALGKPVVDLVFPPEMRQHYREEFIQAGKTGVGPIVGQILEIAAQRSDETTFPAEIATTLLTIPQGFHFTIFLRDISLRREHEQQILELNYQLERRIEEATAANRELEAFCYSVSHDLRSPLRSIDGFSQALIEDYNHLLDKDGQDYLARVRTATQRMGRLIDDLLNLSRVSRTELHREKVNLSELANIVATELQRNHAGRAVNWTIAPAVVVQADSSLLRIILENLLGNAWKYTNRKDQANIQLGVIQNRNERVIFVQDDGAGFDMTFADKLFMPFNRLHRADEFEGTGIGLATVQRIVHRHGGRVWAEGVVGQGATFYFTL